MEQSKAVDAVASHDDIKIIREHLALRPMELLLFELGISSGMRIKELLALRICDMTSGEAYYCLNEPRVKTAFEKYCGVWAPQPNDYIFRKLRKNEPLAFSAVTTMVKTWFEECGLKGNFSSRSLYKTWETLSSRKNGIHDDSTVGGTAYALTPIDTNSVQNQVQEKLYQAIITGSIPAGTKLIVSRLAQQLECNAIQVRVALAHLEEQGMVETRTSKTCVVRSLTKDDIREIAELRVLLESYAIDVISKNWQRETGTMLGRIIEKWRISRDVGECVYLHSAFHEMLYRDTHSPMLLEYIKNLAGRMNGLHIQYHIEQQQYETIIDSEVYTHQELLELVMGGDFEAAKAHAVKDIRYGETMCLKYLEQLEQRRAAAQNEDDTYFG